MADDEVIEIAETSEQDDCERQQDSDCEIQEDDVPVIEVVGSDEESFINEKQEEEQKPKEESPQEHVNNSQKETIFRVAFYDEENFRNLKECVISALTKCLRDKGICIDVYDDEKLNIYVVKEEGLLEEVEETNEVNALKSEVGETEDIVLDNLFLIDTTPAEKIDAGSIPSYKRSIKDVLNNDSKRSKKDDEKCARPKMNNTCFNCFGSHSLKDCPEPRNQSRINKARKQFMEAKSEQRYHIDIEQRFAHLKPGLLSNNLRKALGLNRDELPSFVYKMRLLGYPPGWLEEAKVAHSGIALFDSEGRVVLGSDEEEGEVDNEKHKYDITKIISFPGFNVDPGPDYFDDYKFYGVPPMQLKDLKEEFIKSLGDNIVKGYKRRKLKALSASVEATGSPVPADMEIEDIDEEIVQYSLNPPLPPPLPEEPVTEPPPPPPEDTPPCTTPANVVDLEDLRDSPSLEDLEAKQRQLLEALENSSSLLDATIHEDSLIDEVLELERESNEDEEKSQASETTTATTATTTIIEQQEATESNDYSNNSSPQTPATRTNKKSSILGTPILKFSPYDKLPEGDLFKKGVSDVINFENLPDSTGKYEKMKVVIQKVRTIVTKLNDEN